MKETYYLKSCESCGAQECVVIADLCDELIGCDLCPLNPRPAKCYCDVCPFF